MTVRDEWHQLVDTLPESELQEVREFLSDLQRRRNDSLWRLLDQAPPDDEPTTPEEDAAAAEARAECLRGDVLSAEEAKRLPLG